MEEPFDELMGPPPGPAQSNKLEINTTQSTSVTPDTSPAYAGSTNLGSSKNSSGPPSSAFSSGGPPSAAFSSHTKDRWSQYEKDEDKYLKDSQMATGRAVASAAERAASRESGTSFMSSPVEDRMDAGGSSLPHPDEIKGAAGRNAASTSDGDRDRVRAEAMKVLSMAESPKRRVPAKLSGINFTRSSSSSRPSHSSRNERAWAVNDAESDDEEDLVDIVQMRSPVTVQTATTEDSSSTKSWSSRYSTNHHVAGLASAKELVEEVDVQTQRRIETSANNMFGSSSSPRKSSSPKVFGSGFSFTNKFFSTQETEGQQSNINLKTIWMDVDLQSNGRSLPSPPFSPSHRGPKSLLNSKKRVRYCMLTALLIVVIAIIAGVLSGGGSSTAQPAAVAKPAVVINENSAKFYVTADVPYDAGEEEKIIRDLETLPVTGDFLVHLGNIQDASVTLCPQQAYISAQAILRASPIPVFVLPGPNDWNNCPDPDIALEDWNHQLGDFATKFFDKRFSVTNQATNRETFAFVQKEVLFIGLHLVGGRKHDENEWRQRHSKNVRWVQDQLTTVPTDTYRAVVLLANARPTTQHEDFFTHIFEDINKIKKPVVYIHANGGDDKFETYKPFVEAPMLTAVQIQSGGSSPPLQIAVGEGSDDPFVFFA
mmetsp:Transcript_22171/g.33520  ORF Transcript_22171/g.33520 Transcript_22171/m.33520 type:complete len:654 (+) Transcript_22171:180-2141(+)|eukprot:CAMPEP_0178925648 /NCGR_PEP_ID=MMETSP0786-20121207/18041_1 /TAXON_ID=186022 /ORGANISM="Thalassionema frauenfeldii, Strain CCMP 1798" /LENGTH=653 /DNA_ID=CAMNT_0020600577 /DNA_START=59 /DNA_END=2020 /DNA_ORIENTATION=+